MLGCTTYIFIFAFAIVRLLTYWTYYGATSDTSNYY